MLLKNFVGALLGGLVPASILCAQPDVRFEVSGGPSFNTLTTGIFRNWGNGWTLGGGFSHPLNESVELTANVAYTGYSYRGGHEEFAVPAVLGFRWRVAGDPSDALEASVGVRASTSISLISPFLSLNVGLYRFNVGEITISNWMDSSPQDVTRVVYRDSGTSTSTGFVALGVGFKIPLHSSIQMGVEGRISKTFDATESFIPVRASVQFDL